MSDNERKAQALVALATNYGKEMPPYLLALWLDLLEPYSVAQVNAVIKAVMKTYEYKTIPPFAIIQRELDRITGAIPVEKQVAIQAASEWERLLAAIEKHGSYGEPELHKTTAYVLRTMGGWAQACQWQTSNLEWRRKEFLESWQLYHGHTETMLGGATAIEASGFVPARQILSQLAPRQLPQ